MSQKQTRLKVFENLNSRIAFSSQQKYPYKISDQTDHLIMFYGTLWVSLGKIGGLWRNRSGQNLKNSKLWFRCLIFPPQKQLKQISLSYYSFFRVLLCFTCIFGIVGDWWRHKNCQDLKFCKFWYNQQFLLQENYNHSKFQIKKIIIYHV